MNLTNTHQRVLSASVLISILVGCIVIGKVAMFALITIIGILTVDEIFCNIVKKQRYSLGYFVSQFAFAGPAVALFFMNNYVLYQIFIYLGLLINLLLIYYLVYVKMDSDIIHRVSSAWPSVVGVYVLVPFIAMGSLLAMATWGKLLALLMFVNFGMDTGAWFFGRKFGKHKLWPSVSPNKTVEGFIGGLLTSAIFGCLISNICFFKVSIMHFIVFMLLGGLSQVGDLIQSKMKRQAKIKDSSHLIPGHGGVFDRIDSILFVLPFFVMALKYIL